MTFLFFLSTFFRLIGIARWADFFLQKHEAKVKAQEQANDRILTKQQELDAIDRLPDR